MKALSRDRGSSMLTLPVSTKKRFTYEHDFVAWGTQVSSKSGRVGCPIAKLKQIEGALAEVAKLPRVTKRILQQAVGLCVHPAMHRREVMCLFEGTFTTIEQAPEGQFFKMSMQCREELLSMALMFPACECQVENFSADLCYRCQSDAGAGLPPSPPMPLLLHCTGMPCIRASMFGWIGRQAALPQPQTWHRLRQSLSP